MTKKILIDETVVKQVLGWIEDAAVVLSHTSTAIQGGLGAEAEGVGGCSVKVLKDLREALEVNNKGVNALVEQPAPSQYGSPELQAMIVARAMAQQAAEPVAGKTRPLGYLPKWSVDRLTGDMGKVADPLVWGLYTHVYLSSVEHGVAIYTSPQSAATQPVADEQRDAARYRWLRENRATLLITGFFGNGCINRAIDEVDKAIDRAIEAAHGITSTNKGE